MDNNNISEFARRFLCIMVWIRNHEDWYHSHQFFMCLPENFTVEAPDHMDDANDANDANVAVNYVVVFHVDILTWFLDVYQLFGNDVSSDKVKSVLQALGIRQAGDNFPNDHSAVMTNIARKLFPLASCTAAMWSAYRHCLYSIRLVVSPDVHAALLDLT